MNSLKNSKRSLLCASALALSLGAITATTEAATLAVDLTTANSGTINDGTNTVTFNFDKQQPSGTGVLDPFLRIQRNRTEQGFNSTQANASLYPFDEKAGIWTHDLLFSSMEAIGGNFNFILDIGEPANGTQSLLSLDGLKLYATNTPGQNSDSVDGNGDANGILGTLLWNMDAQADNYVLLDANRDGQPGNGVSDMLMQMPTSVFSGVTGTQYIILWSRFGLQEGANVGSGSFGTFEEWAQLCIGECGDDGGGGEEGEVPEPATTLLLGTGLLGLWAMRRRKTAA